jgi:hypothetical protein
MKFSERFKSRLEANVGIGGCVSPQPRFDSDISEMARLWRAFSFFTIPFSSSSKRNRCLAGNSPSRIVRGMHIGLCSIRCDLHRRRSETEHQGARQPKTRTVA